MRKFILLSGCVIAIGGMTGATVAKPKSASACNAEYYSDLVGQDVSKTQQISQNMRLVPQGTTVAAANAKRLTITYDETSRRITAVSCG